MSTQNKRYRVQLSFNESSFNDLEELEKTVGLSRQELFKHALKWFQWTVDQTQSGNKLLIQDSTGEVHRIVLPFLEQSPSSQSDQATNSSSTT